MSTEDGGAERESADELLIQAKRRAARAAIPAVYIDTWSVMWRGNVLRLTLAEWINGGPQYRFAATVELDDAERLGEHLLKMAKRAREDLADEAKSAEQNTTTGLLAPPTESTAET